MERVQYCSIVERPPLKWPGGARVALWVVPNVEVYEYLPPRHPQRESFMWKARSPHPDIVGYASRDYGNRVGLWRLMEVLDRHGIRATASINMAVFEHFPAIIEAIEARKWDYMCHGMYNTRYLWGIDIEEERSMIRECKEIYRRHTGRELAGFIGPGLSNSVNTPDLVAEAGFKYYGDYGQHDDQPFPLRVKSGRLITLPYSSNLGDAINERQGHEAEDFGRFIRDYFDTLYEEGEQQGRVLSINIHPFIIGQPHRIRFLDDALAYICRHPGVWKATGEEIADWYYANHWEKMNRHLQAA